MMWPFAKSPPPKRTVVIEHLPSTELRLSDWQASTELVVSAQKLKRDPAFRTMLDVLRNESPANFALPITGMTADDRIAHASRIEGYNLALNNIDAMAHLNNTREPLEATFEPEPITPSVQGTAT